MNTHSEHIDALIALVLQGQANSAQMLELNAWRASSAENEAYFQDMEKAFSKSRPHLTDIGVNVDLAWNKVKARIEEKARETPVVQLQRKPSGLVWKIAAAVVLLLGVSVVLFQTIGKQEESFALQSFNQSVRDTLTDGTIAVLNANSQLRYSVDQKEKKRKVIMQGEAFFEIQHNDSLEFLVQTDDLMIRDIGTAFNVQALPDADTVKVYVREGIVELYTESLKGIKLESEESGYYVRSTKEFGKFSKSEEVNPDSYATGDFRFRNTRLEKVVNKLNEYFHVHIALESPEMKSCPWSIHLLDSDLDTILGVFAETFAFTVERNGTTILLKGGTCQDIPEK